MALVLLDKTTNNNDLTNNNSVSESNDTPFAASTKSADFENSGGENQFLSIPDASQTGLDITGDFTIEAWIKPETISSSSNIITSKFEDDSGNNRAWMFGIYDSAGTKKLWLRVSSDGTGAGSELEEVTVSIATGTWYHVATTYDNAGTVKFYLDGTQVGGD